jgi:hypothetical protein
VLKRGEVVLVFVSGVIVSFASAFKEPKTKATRTMAMMSKMKEKERKVREMR